MLKSLKQIVKSFFGYLRQKRNAKALESSRRHITVDELTQGLKNLGIGSGDVVFLHSSLKSLGFVEGGPRSVIDALCSAVGTEGTVIVPTYFLPGGTIHATCLLTDYVFDPARCGSNLGALPAAFLKYPGVKRSIHPTHSVSAVGKLANFITDSHHLSKSIFGTGSPWQRCIEVNGKVLGLGISMGPVTFYHTLEDSLGDAFPLPVRMKEEFQLPCRNWAGEMINVPVVPLDPEFMPRRIDHPGRDDLRAFFWDEFTKAGLIHTGVVGEAKSWYIESQAFYGHLERLAADGITIYATPEELQRTRLRSSVTAQPIEDPVVAG